MMHHPIQRTLPGRNHGFTLIQAFAGVAAIAAMLVVVVVIAPLFMKARGSARASCQSNLKQIGLAIMQYTQDNDECYPRTTNGTSTGLGYKVVSWRRALDPYTRTSVSMWQCVPPPSPNPNSDVFSPFDNLPLCYDVTDSGPVRRDLIIDLSKVASPSATFMVFEKNGDSPQAQQIGVLWDHDTGERGWTNILYGGHRGGSNYLFADGHVRWFSPINTIADGINRWHLNPNDPVSPRALEKLEAAERSFSE